MNLISQWTAALLPVQAGVFGYIIYWCSFGSVLLPMESLSLRPVKSNLIRGQCGLLSAIMGPLTWMRVILFGL